MAAATDQLPGDVRTSEEVRPSARKRLRELYAHRQILMNLIRKEVKVKYTSSKLGAIWSMLNPLLYLAVFTLVFAVVLNSNIHPYAVYLLSGLLAWNLFSGSLSLGVRSVVDNANLVKKVYMPREVLPLASLGASMVDFALQLLVLVVFMVVLRHVVVGWNLLLLPLAFVTLVVLCAAFSLWVAALNVRYRDTQHLLNLVLLAWFWFTPIVYPSGGLQARLQHHGSWLWTLYLANPLAAVIFGFQRALFGSVAPCQPVPPNTYPQCVLVHASVGWEAMLLGCVLAGGLVLLYVFWRRFFHLSGDFAEEL